MAIDPKSLTIDYRSLLRMTVADRRAIMKSPVGLEIMNSLTPGQRAKLFPDYYKQMGGPSSGGVGSSGGGLSEALSGGTSLGGGGGTSSGYTPPTGFQGPAGAPPTGPMTPSWMQRWKEKNNLVTKTQSQTQSQNLTQSGATQQTTSSLSGFKVSGGATIPKSADKDTIQALNSVASRYGLRPEAIAMMINLESGWSTKAPTGSYYGLTQMGAATFREAGGKLGGLSWDEYKRATPAQQIQAYGDWLQHYKFGEQAQKHGIDFNKLSAPQQAAYLQGMQFAPNAQGWKKAFAQGNYNIRTTDTAQARALGSTSIADMTRYYEGVAAKNPAVEEASKVPPTAKEQPGIFPGGPGTLQPIEPTKQGKYRNENKQKLHLLDSSGFNPVLKEAIIEGSKRTFGDPNDPNTRYEIRIGNTIRHTGGGKHTIGEATDLQIYDRETGKYVGDHNDIMLSSYGNPYSYNMHKDLARGMYQFLNEKYGSKVADQLSWGGNFFAKQGHTGGASVYNGPPVDTMHYSFNEPGQKGRQGSITGLPSEQVQQWLAKYGVTPTEMGDVAKWQSPYLAEQVAALPYPEGFDKLDENLRKEIESMPVTQRNALIQDMQKVAELGGDPISSLNEEYRSTGDAATAAVAALPTTSPPPEGPQGPPQADGTGPIMGPAQQRPTALPTAQPAPANQQITTGATPPATGQPTAEQPPKLGVDDNLYASPFEGINTYDMPVDQLNLSPEVSNFLRHVPRQKLQQQIDKNWRDLGDFKKAIATASPNLIAKGFNKGYKDWNKQTPEEKARQGQEAAQQRALELGVIQQAIPQPNIQQGAPPPPISSIPPEATDVHDHDHTEGTIQPVEQQTQAEQVTPPIQPTGDVNLSVNKEIVPPAQPGQPTATVTPTEQPQGQTTATATPQGPPPPPPPKDIITSSKPMGEGAPLPEIEVPQGTDVPLFAKGGEKQLSGKDNLAIVDTNTGKTEAMVNRGEVKSGNVRVNPQSNRLEVTPPQRTNPADIVQRTQAREDYGQQIADQKSTSQTVQRQEPRVLNSQPSSIKNDQAAMINQMLHAAHGPVRSSVAQRALIDRPNFKEPGPHYAYAASNVKM